MIFRRGLRRHLRRTLIVHTRDGRSIRGVLVGEHSDCVVLAHAELLDHEISLGGEVVILLENVSWAQDVTGIERTALEAEKPFTLARGERP